MYRRFPPGSTAAKIVPGEPEVNRVHFWLACARFRRYHCAATYGWASSKPMATKIADLSDIR